MDTELRELLESTHDVHVPLPVDLTASADARLAAKPVLASRLLDDMQSLARWSALTDHIELSLSAEHTLHGPVSLKAVMPTNLPDWLPGRARGRIYAEPGALRVIDREDWTAWNRLSVWIFPDVPGMKSVVLRLQLYNDGAHKVPDIHLREGAHNVSLVNGQWNHVTVEIAYEYRDCVTGVAIEYDMCGHEPDAADRFVWYADRLELQKVEAEVLEGWAPGPGRIAFSGSGCQPGQRKLAIAAGLPAATFRVLALPTGKVVLEKPIRTVRGRTGELQVLDFSELTTAGRYLLAAGEATTGAFAIDAHVWEPSIWKTLNFFLCQRCGHEVPGKHRACHADVLLRHEGRAIVANGGWHDAADLAQGMDNTADATAALLRLAESLRDRHPRLHARVLEEAKWGLDYTLRMRFGDGFRSAYSSSSIWTDGVIGTADDIVSTPANSPYTNFVSAHAEALGALAFADTDRAYAAHCRRIAAEDYALARAVWDGQPAAGHLGGRRPVPAVALAAVAAAAAAELHRAGAGPQYREDAVRFARLLVSCQQRRLPDWDVPLRGFFYQDPEHTVVWHHNHLSQAQYPLVALESLIEQCPDHPDCPLWYSAVLLNGEFHRRAAAHTAPYGMVPEGVYHVEEAERWADRVLPLHPLLAKDDSLVTGYRRQVEQGVPLGKGWYLRAFPVWFSFRGNLNVQLSQGIGIGIAARLGRDLGLYTLAQEQLEWVVGKNPFASSLMCGEGHDWIPLYAVQCGQTVGQLPVGIQSFFERDAPYFPQVCTATYKEVWICPATKWVWNMVYAHLPAVVAGLLPGAPGEPVVFRRADGSVAASAVPRGRAGEYRVELPAGEYEVTWNGQRRRLRLVPGITHETDAPLKEIAAVASAGPDGADGAHVVVRLQGDPRQATAVSLRALNLAGLPERVELAAGQRLEVKAAIQSPGEPWLVLARPEGRVQDTSICMG